MEGELINRVSNSPLITIDLEEFYPKGNRKVIDIKAVLFQEIMLKELEFRQWLKEHNWNEYHQCHVAIYCSADAIVPQWAYMLIASKLSGVANTVHFGNLETLEDALFDKALDNNLVLGNYLDKPVVIKGCFNKPVPTSAYVKLTALLTPFAKSIMYGEPCSTVPVFKRNKEKK